MGGSTTKLHEPNYSNTATNMSGLEDVDASEVTYSSNYDAADECSTFDEMNLKEDLLRGIYAYGFEKPSTIQQRAIIPIVKGEDTIAQAQSGTGKTATFSRCPWLSIMICQRIVRTTSTGLVALVVLAVKVLPSTSSLVMTFARCVTSSLSTTHKSRRCQ